MNKFLQLIIITGAVFFLQCCAGTSVITTGASVVYNKNHLMKVLDEQSITARSYQRIYTYNNRYRGTNVSISTFNDVVLITGQIPDAQRRSEIESIVRQIANNKKVFNLTTVSPPISTLVQTGDTWITTKIKSKFIASNTIDPSKIKVITENGTVYLMGIVPHEQADEAVELARTTDGVQNVVKVFSYLTISKV